jgi:hypothetical protein
MKEDAMPERPWTVTIAVYMLYLDTGLFMLWSGPFVPYLMPIILVPLILTYYVGRGHNGARSFVLSAVVLGTALFVWERLVGAYFNYFHNYFQIVQIGLQPGAAVLLFQRASSRWFKAMKKLRTKDESGVAI